MSDFKITTPGVWPKTSPLSGTSGADAGQSDAGRIHARLDALMASLEQLTERVDKHIDKSKLVFDAHRSEIDSLREMVATLWDKTMSGHQEFMRKVDSIIHPKKPRRD